MNTKRIIYIISTMVLGLLLSFIVHAGIEIWYINRLISERIVPKASPLFHNCFLPSYLQILLILAGLAGGYFLGQWWYRLVYIERRRDK